MALSPGTHLGPYEILAPLGAGGMGEVYKAKDTRLDRTVAIKVLPSHLSDDAGLKERFEREARAVSSLNHPHICTLHDIGSENGVDFMVMEHIEGDTLAHRLKKGALPLDQALKHAAEIADALDKAHRRGVVHRDLKPGNIMLTGSGTKLLDFGLAKQKAPEAEGDGSVPSALPTEQAPLTKEGSILGTFQYMSPEQLEGKEADSRSDIFAFGAVLYEMLTGRKAFEGKSQASLIASILTSDPPAMKELEPMAPAALERTVRRCLAKEPDSRWQSARDLGSELQWIGAAGSREATPELLETRPKRRVRLWVLGAFLAGALATGLALWTFLQPAPPLLTRLAVTLPSDQRLVRRRSSPIALSPDGRALVYAARTEEGTQNLYLRELDRLDARAIPGTEGAHTPFYSPDGQWIGFLTNDALKRTTPIGGAPLTVASLRQESLGASWGRDDTILFAISAPPVLFRVPAGGGTSEPVTELEGDTGSHRYPSILPDGDSVLFTVMSGPALALLSLETGGVRSLEALGAASGGQYLPTGHLVYASSGALLAVPFDEEQKAVKGAPTSLLDGIFTTSDAPYFTVSKSGTLAYVRGDSADVHTLSWVDREGQPTPITVGSRFHAPRLSPEGRRLAFSDSGDIWVYEMGRGTRTRMTVDGANDYPVWTPDGARIAFEFIKEGSSGVYWMPADSSGEAELLRASEYRQRVMSFSPDGRFLAVTEIHPTTGFDIWVLPVDGEPIPFLVTSFAENAARFSPDGRFVAYQSSESGRQEVYVRPFPGPGARSPISTDGGTAPVWSADGKELFYRRGSDMMVANVSTKPTFSAGKPRRLFGGNYFADMTGHPGYDVASDGQTFLMSQEAQGEHLNEVNIVLNWFEELKRLVPTD